MGCDRDDRGRGHRWREGRNLSEPSDHDHCAVPGRRADRHGRAHHERAHEQDARPVDPGRDRDRCGRHHRRRPRGQRAAGRLHARHRQLVEPRRLAGALSGVVESGERSRADRTAAGVVADDRRQGSAAGQRRQGADRLAQGQSGQGVGGERRRGQRRARLRPLFRREDRHQVPVRVLPRRRAGDAGHAGGNDRHHVRRGVADAGACHRRQDEGLRGDGAKALCGAARCADHGGDGHHRNGYFVLAWPVGAEGHAEGHRRQAQRRGGQGAGRSRPCRSASRRSA